MNWKRYWISVFIISGIMFLFDTNDYECVMVGSYGGGYSGFWYYYGKPKKNIYYLDKIVLFSSVV